MADWGHQQSGQKGAALGFACPVYGIKLKLKHEIEDLAQFVSLAAFPAYEATSYIHNQFLIF